MYKELTTNELKSKLERYQAELESMMADKYHEEGTAEWLRIEIMKMKKELSKR
jgi:hypothetical protein